MNSLISIVPHDPNTRLWGHNLDLNYNQMNARNFSVLRCLGVWFLSTICGTGMCHILEKNGESHLWGLLCFLTNLCVEMLILTYISCWGVGVICFRVLSTPGSSQCLWTSRVLQITVIQPTFTAWTLWGIPLAPNIPLSMLPGMWQMSKSQCVCDRADSWGKQMDHWALWYKEAAAESSVTWT